MINVSEHFDLSQPIHYRNIMFSQSTDVTTNLLKKMQIDKDAYYKHWKSIGD